MGRIITADKIEQIAAHRAADPEALGPMLGELIIKGNVPVEAVAYMLAVSEPTVYRWMYGHANPRDADKIIKIKKLLTILRKGFRARDLPLHGPMKTRITDLGRVVKLHSASREEATAE